MFVPLQISYGAIVLPQSPAAALSSGLLFPPSVTKVAKPFTCCSRLCQQVAITSPDVGTLSQFKPNSEVQSPITTKLDGDFEDAEAGEKGSGRISGIQVPRPRYISVSKSELLNAIVSTMFKSQVKADLFIRLSKCLDTILHAEHKSILEEMRINYDLTCCMESKGTEYKNLSSFESPLVSKESNAVIKNPVKTRITEDDEAHRAEQEKPNHNSGLHLQLGSSSNNDKTNSVRRVPAYTRFQCAFVQLLYNAEFVELSARDLQLTSALNTNYLLTLPINVDWKRAFQSNAIIYRRGYTTEKQKGLLTVEKLDYLQSKLLQRIFLLIAKPLGKFGIWSMELLGSTRQENGKLLWTETLRLWLEKLPLLQSNSYDEVTSNNQVVADHPIDSELPIWLAAQRAVTRYEGILSAIGPRERLFRKLLVWIGLLPPSQEQAFDLNSTTSGSDAESPLRPIFLPRISLSDILEPASRRSCGNDFWKMFKTVISILLSQSTLQEPAFKELILLYTGESDGTDTEDKAEISSLQLKIYEKIPIPDLPVIFPHKKLSFRILDTVRLDVATILGLLAYFINYKFENISSSPSAIVLDVIAVTALIIYVIRVVLGYKQTRDRYQLLVNRTLYEKTVASGFGTVHFLLDASEQQLYKEAILAYAIILTAESDKMTARSVGDKCEYFISSVFNKKIEMPIDKAKTTLSRLGLVTEKTVDGEDVLQAVPCAQAYEILTQRWNCLLT